ncbi:MAG: hypothetical protein K6L80_03530 [Agarilytica sp.]
MINQERWWGDFHFNEEETKEWVLGDRRFVIHRSSGEWKTWNIETPEESGEYVFKHSALQASAELPDHTTLGRYLQHETSEQISVRPMMADRSMVIRPSVPLQILAEERICLYISTPLWFNVKTCPNDVTIMDVPFWRPSDSWFGPSTMSGEFCYAKYTDARVNITQLEQRPHRAITPIHVINKRNEALIVERLSIPVPLLHLFSDDKHHLWTEEITLTRESDGDMAKLQLDKVAPPHASNPTLVSKPRTESEKNIVFRTLNSLFA